MAEIASAFVTLIPSAKDFGSKLNKQIGGDVDKSGKGAGKRFGASFGPGMKVGAVAAAVAAGAFLKGSIAEAREAQKVGAQTTSVIKATGGAANVTAKQVGNLATSLSNKTGIDDEVIQSGQNMLLTFKNVRNEAGKGNDVFNQASKTLVDMSAAMGTAPKQAAIQLGKALNDPIKGISALSRVGVTFTDGQKKTIKSLVDGGKTMQAQKIILKELNSEFGGSAEAQATAGDKFKVAFGNLQEAVGTALLPLIDTLLPKLTAGIGFLSTSIGPAIAKIGQAFSSLGGNGAGPVSALASTFTNVVLPAMQRIGSYVGANLLPIFRQVGGIIANQVVPIVASLGRFLFGTLYPAILKIYAAIATNLKPVFDQLFRTLQGTVLPAVSRLLVKFHEAQPTIQKVIVVVLKVVGALLTFSAAVLGKVLPPLIRFVGFMLKNTVGAVIAVITVLARIVGAIIRVGAAFVNGVKAAARFGDGINNAVRKGIGYVEAIPGKVKGALGGLGGLLVHAGEELIQGLIDGIGHKLAALGEKMKAVASKVKGFLPGSPVKEGPLTSWNNGGAGKRLIDLLALGLEDTRSVDRAMSRLGSRFETKLALNPPRIPRTPHLSGLATSGPAAAASRGGDTYNIYETTSPGATAREISRRQAFAGRF